jgi:hypothetical protein
MSDVNRVVGNGIAFPTPVEFLRKISAENQTLYSTQSPFMVDVKHLEEVRTVYEHGDSGATLVSEDVWPRDPDARLPCPAGPLSTLVD